MKFDVASVYMGDYLLLNMSENGLKPVLKHQEHDQSTHGSWATGGSSESGLDSIHGDWALSENFPDLLTLEAFDEETNIVGVEKYEHDAIDSYSQSGYININDYLRGSGGVRDEYNRKYLQQHVDGLDSLIENSPDMFGDKTLFRVIDDEVLGKLTPGAIMVDKGFLSTSRIDLTRDADARYSLGDISSTPDTVGVILPSPTKRGKGIATDLYRTSVNDPSPVSAREKEILLPRNTVLKFLGYRTNIGLEAKVAVFQRVEK